jgi:hypothetical protein
MRLNDGVCDDSAPWQQQPWESSVAYARFATYYLALTPDERSLAQAYNDYLRDKGLAGRKKTAPGNWVRWAQGLDGHGRKRPGALTWHERAAAWDQYREQLRAEALVARAAENAAVWAERRIALAEHEWATGWALLERAATMLDSTELFCQELRDGVAVLVPNRWREADIRANAQVGTALARRAAGLPLVAVAVDDWRAQLAAAGYDPERVMAKFIAAMASEPATAAP